MIHMTLSEVARAAGGRLADPSDPFAGAAVTSVISDSRAAAPGTLFAAIAGARVDGHDFVAAVLEAGAVGALVTRKVPGVPAGRQVLVADVTLALGALARHALVELRRRRPSLRVIGITGSYGKTTTKDLLAQLLQPLGDVIAPVGSFNSEVGLPLTVLRASTTTDVLVLEMGADAIGDLTYLTSIAPPDVAIELAVGAAHLQGFGSIENVAIAKGELLTGSLPGAVCLLNADDRHVAAMSELAAGREVLTFSRAGSAATVRAADITAGHDGRASFRLISGVAGATGEAPVVLALTGEHQVSNALAAATAALQLGVSLPEVATGLALAGPTSPHRMAMGELPGRISLIDDSYNANPTAMRAALATLAHIGQGRRTVAVIAEMLELGEASSAEHAMIGSEAGRTGVDLLVSVAAPAELGAAAELAGVTVHRAENVDHAGELLAAQLRADDVVLIKGSLGTGVWRLADQLPDILTERAAAQAGEQR